MKSMKEQRIPVNEEFELLLRFGPEDRSKDVGRKFNLVLLDKKTQRDQDRVILRADNSHRTGVWPRHIHKPNSHGRHFFITNGGEYAGGLWEEFKMDFLKEALSRIGEAYRDVLTRSLESATFTDLAPLATRQWFHG